MTNINDELAKLEIQNKYSMAFDVGHVGVLGNLGGGGFDNTGLKAYYKFNESSGNLINLATSVGSSDSNGVDLSNPSGVTQSATGLIGDAYLYSATNGQSKESAASTNFEFMYNTTSGVFSFVGWVKYTTATQAGSTIVCDTSNIANSTGALIIMTGSNNNRVVQFVLSKSDNSDELFSTSAGTFPSDTDWHMIFVSWDSSDGAVQISVDDGTKATGTSTITGISGTAAEPFTLSSARATPIQELDSTCDEYSFWNRVLTDAEVTQLYNSGAGLAL